METVLATIFSEYGVIAGCFVALLVWTVRENKSREVKYQETIHKNQEVILEQAKNFNIVKEIRQDVSELKRAITERK